MKQRTSSTFVVCALGLALSAWACGANNESTANDRTGQPAAAGADRTGTPGATAGAADANGTARPAGTSGTAAGAADTTSAENAQPITLTGCLQKGDGTLRSDFVLTEVNTSRASVGTSGAGANPKSDVVGQEQMRQAEHAYRLDGDRDDLDKLVGKQVRVSGTIEKRSDLNDHSASGTVKDRDRTKIDDGDLAQVKVASVTSIGSACGGKAGRTKK